MSQAYLAYYAILVYLLIFQRFNTCNSSPIGLSIKMIMVDSPGSPLYPGNLTQLQRLERMAKSAQARAKYLEISTSLSSGNMTSNQSEIIEPQDVVMALFRQSYFYVAQLLIGNPPLDVYLVMDTGGSLVWTQCLPCIKCYKQTNPIYAPKDSSTYRKLPCAHPLCDGPRAPFTCFNDECVYSQSYGGGETGPTEGVASFETFRFMLSSGGHASVGDIIFGCSTYNLHFPFANTPISGVMGLSWAPESLATQFGPYARFSYCLVPFHMDPMTPSTLTFGDAIPGHTGNVLSTPLAFPPLESQSHYFYLNLIDISVGQERLGFPPGTFGHGPDGREGGFIIDSGAGISVLKTNGVNPYEQVLSAFERYYSTKGLKKTTVKGFRLCYNYRPGFSDFATMTYHFQGADHVVDGMFVSLFGDINGLFFCIALLPEKGLSILGAVHQQNTRFIYDKSAVMLKFYKEVCA